MKLTYVPLNCLIIQNHFFKPVVAKLNPKNLPEEIDVHALGQAMAACLKMQSALETVAAMTPDLDGERRIPAWAYEEVLQALDATEPRLSGVYVGPFRII